MLRNKFKRGLEFWRRQVAIQAQDHFSCLIEKKQGGRELHFLAGGEAFLVVGLAVERGELAVAPHIDRDDIEILAHQILDIFLRQVAFYQRIAIGTVFLREQQHDTLTMDFRLGDIIA